MYYKLKHQLNNVKRHYNLIPDNFVIIGITKKEIDGYLDNRLKNIYVHIEESNYDRLATKFTELVDPDGELHLFPRVIAVRGMSKTLKSKWTNGFQVVVGK